MTIRVLLAMLFGALLSACAASPPAPLVDTTSDQTTALDKKAREMGYHIETRNGEKAYCHNAAPTASHISRQDCLGTAGMTQLVQNAEKSQDELARRQQQNYSGSRPIS